MRAKPINLSPKQQLLYEIAKQFETMGELRANWGFGTTSTTTTAFPYDADYQAVLNRGTALGYTLPSLSQRLLQNQFVLDLKAAGIWTLLEFLHVFATDGDSDFATLNWKNPLLYQCLKVNNPTFTVNFGFTGNGTTQYLNTQFTPSTNCVIATNISASIGIQVNGGNQANRDSIEFGAYNTSGNKIMQLGTNFLTTAPAGRAITRLCMVPGAVEQWNNSGSANGNYIITKVGTLHNVYQNAGLEDTRTVTTTALPTSPITYLAMPADGVIGNFSDRRLSGGFIAGSLAAKETAYNTAWTTYFNSL